MMPFTSARTVSDTRDRLKLLPRSDSSSPGPALTFGMSPAFWGRVFLRTCAPGDPAGLCGQAGALRGTGIEPSAGVGVHRPFAKVQAWGEVTPNATHGCACPRFQPCRA